MDVKAFWNLLEPGASAPIESSDLDMWPSLYALQASAAISLKRLADALREPNEYGEVGTAAVAGAIVRGLRGS